MGATPNRGYPYPEDSDLVIQGDDAIQALAEALDADLAWASDAVFARADSPATAGAPALVVWGAPASIHGFTYDGAGTLTYTNPSRLFFIDAEVTIDNGGAADVVSAIEVRVNGAAIAGSSDRTQVSSGTVNRYQVHRVTTVAALDPGSTVDVTAYASPTGPMGTIGLRIVPMSPVF